MSKSRDTQVSLYGGEEGYKKEMARRRGLVKNFAFRADPNLAKAAVNKRWAKNKGGVKDAGKDS